MLIRIDTVSLSFSGFSPPVSGVYQGDIRAISVLAEILPNAESVDGVPVGMGCHSVQALELPEI